MPKSLRSKTPCIPPGVGAASVTTVSTLSNGLRVASCSMPASQTAAVGIWCAVGSRSEPDEIGGISHFLEHLLFKGTKKRSARRISEEIEGVGGDLNAFTAEERTCYYAAAAAEHFSRMTGVLSDMYCNSLLESAEVERERGVIAEEIEMVRDEPAQHVHELLNTQTWKGHALARPITGTKETLAAIKRKDLIAHLRGHYHAGNTVFTAAGAVEHGEVLELAEKFLGALPAYSGKKCTLSLPKTKTPAPQKKPLVLVERREGAQQSQLAFSFRGVGAKDPRRYAVSLLHILLGGNMSSRLFQELRERRGLCYSVSTSLSTHSDCGSFDVSLGLDGDKVLKALRLILRECARVAEKGVSPAELRRARDYSIGTSRMALERAATQNYRLGTALLTHGKIVPPEEVYDSLTKVTREEIRSVARDLFRKETISLAMIGPGPGKEELMELIRSV